MKRVPYLIFLTFLISSCKSETYLKVAGSWVIDDIKLKNESIKRDLLVNGFVLIQDGECTLPGLNTLSNDFPNTFEGKWRLNQGETHLYLDSEHPILRGKFRMDFKKDLERKLLVMILSKDSVYMESSKEMYNID